MSISIRKLVSKKKRRYTKQGFDLDLSYITDKVIAMGFPSENMEGVYRNPFKEVFRFLELMHKDHYKVYNLCSERSYDISKFHNRVECFPFDDHNCPTIELLIKFCANVKEWLSAHEKNVAVIHCKAGKGRTGLMICSYMLYSKEWNTPKDALDFYAAMRTYNKKGVTIPSQIRYVHYMGAVMNTFNGKAPEPRTLLLKSITFHALPNVSHVSDIKFSAYVFKTLIYSFKDLPKVRGGKKNKDKKKGEEDEEQLVFELPNVPLHGDIKMDFYEKDTFGSDKLFYFWFNTSLVNTTQEFTKEELDKANKDKNCKVFPSNFKITLQFEPLASPTPENPSNGTVQNLMKMPSTNDLSKAVNQLTTKESAEFTDDEDDDDDEETENLLRDPIKSVDNLLQQLIAIKLNSNNKSDLKSTREFKLFEQGVLDLEMVALDQLTTQQEKLAFWINTFNVLMLYLNISKPPVKNETINERFASLNNRKFNIGGQLFTILDIQFALLRKGKSQPSYVTENKLETYTMAFAATDPRSMYAIEGKDPRIIFALCFGTISSPLIHVYHSSSIYDELDEAVRVFLHSNVFVNDSIKSITLPKILDWYCSDFGKTPEKMLKSLSSYLTSEQKSAVSNGYSVVYQEHDWNPHYSLSHFEQK